MSQAAIDESSGAGVDAGDPAPAWRWIVQGARSAVFLRPDWRGLRGTPALLAAAIIANLAVAIAAQRLFLVDAANFYWRSLTCGWLPDSMIAWGCWLALRRPAAASDAPRPAIDAPSLMTLLLVQALVFDVATSFFYVPVVRGVGGLHWPTGALTWLPTLVHVAWAFSAQVRLALDGTHAASPGRRAGLVAALAVALASGMLLPFGYWQAARPPAATAQAGSAARPAISAASAASQAGDDDDVPMLRLSQETFERQQQLLARQLDAIEPQRRGVVDLYAITFAPYADVDVFMRESAVVADVLQSRFDTRGRTLQLVNNVATTDRLAWATPMNLQRAIARMAQRMDRDADILFIHLTSHGGANGQLATEFFPLTEEPLTPRLLRRWLDEAHVRNAVISISACFSGSWIAALANDDTLVMTAADAEHTSYGCGSRSTLTFFGQAMYDEQLRHTWSFEQAHAASRKLIEQREKDAGKTDGYSNPQIRVGARIRERLKALEARLAASAAR